MATTEMIHNGGPEGAPHENAPHQSLAGGSSIGDAGEALSQHARGRSPVGGNVGRLGLDYATGEQFE